MSEPEKVNVIDVEGVPPSKEMEFLSPSIAEEIDTAGATVSTVQLYNPGLASSCPELSSARTLNVCGPSLSGLGNVNGLVQVTNSSSSMLHSK